MISDDHVILKILYINFWTNLSIDDQVVIMLAPCLISLLVILINPVGSTCSQVQPHNFVAQFCNV